MDNLTKHITNYLEYCQYQKRLDKKTLKAYQIDLAQFCQYTGSNYIMDISTETLEHFIAYLHQNYRPKTAKRKIASLKALFHYFEYKDLIERNPFNKLQVKFREPVILPKTIPLHTVEIFLSTIYKQLSNANTNYQKRNTLRDIAVIELLFATGIRISELCSLKTDNVNLYDKSILIYGKGAKERKIQIGNNDVIHILEQYKTTFQPEIQHCGYFFVNQSGRVLTD